MSSRRKRDPDTKSNRSVAFSDAKTPIKRQTTNISSQTRIDKDIHTLNTLKNGMINAENFSQHASRAPEMTQQMHE